MQSKTSQFAYKIDKNKQMNADEVSISKFRVFIGVEEPMMESTAMEHQK